MEYGSDDGEAGGKAVMTFDVCYHPQTLARGRDSAAFLKMLIGTALDGVDLALSKTNPNDGQVSRGAYNSSTSMS